MKASVIISSGGDSNAEYPLNRTDDAIQFARNLRILNRKFLKLVYGFLNNGGMDES